MTNRIRYLKPDFFLDEDAAALPPLVRLFFQGLWCHADRAGRLEDRPQRLRVEIMPYEDGFSVEDALAILAKPKAGSGRPFIVRYEVEGRRYIQILSWAQHQRPHPHEQPSTIPPPPDHDTAKALPKHGQGTAKQNGDLNGDGDGDLNLNGDGDRNGESEGERKGEKIAPPAPIRGSGSAEDAEPSLPPPDSPQRVKKIIDGTSLAIGKPKGRKFDQVPCGEKEYAEEMKRAEKALRG